MNKQFKEWVIDTYPAEYFPDVPFAFKWGVYLEFFDSVGIDITVERYVQDKKFEYRINGELQDLNFTRQEAQKEAIKKAFEILENNS